MAAAPGVWAEEEESAAVRTISHLRACFEGCRELHMHEVGCGGGDEDKA